MWDRPMLKHYAKEQLRQYYWMALLVCFVGGLLGGGAGGSSFTYSVSGSGGGYSGNDLFHNPAWGAFLIAMALTAVLAGIAFLVFISGPVNVGICDYFASAPWGRRDFSILFSAFRRGRYLSIVKTMLVKDLFIFLWSLLFIIPGIIKSYEYRMVPYIINENPHLSPREAIEYGKIMTDNQKWNIFVLDLSFIGWSLLGVLAFGIGVIFVTPYIQATEAQLYFALRQNVHIPGLNPGHGSYGM